MKLDRLSNLYDGADASECGRLSDKYNVSPTFGKTSVWILTVFSRYPTWFISKLYILFADFPA